MKSVRRPAGARRRLVMMSMLMAASLAGSGALAEAPQGTPPETPAPSPTPTPTSAAPAKPEPFAFANWGWLQGTPRTTTNVLDTKYFTGEFRVDVNYIYDMNQPKDHTIGGSTEVGRAQEFQLQQLGLGGDFHAGDVRGRFMTQIGMYSTMTPRNDSSPSRGQWDLTDAYRYISEAWGGIHINALNGINVDGGIFLSYIGLFSYYNFDNWAYQPSYVSSNTPWFFNGLRIQIFPSDKLKIEPWIINGWQSYGMFNSRLGFGGQILWRPNPNVSVVLNNYVGTDALNNPDRRRLHTDDSVTVRYLDHPASYLSKAAFSFTFDAGCESGGGVSCSGSATDPAQYFIGFMVYNRFWFAKDTWAFTVGGGMINNPGRYLVLLPPINGATATTGTTYFTENPGDPYKAWDYTIGFDYMPEQWITFRAEFNHRGANVPYFSGSGGITPDGGNQGAPGSVVDGFTPDLRKYENRINMAILVKF